MDTYCIVRPEHLNHYGHLFGGAMLSWIDEFAWLAASLDFPGCKLVTMAMDNIVFKKPAPCGSILRFSIEPVRLGTTSVTYNVAVLADAPGATQETHIVSTTITFVRLDETGMKTDLPRLAAFRSKESGLGPLPQTTQHIK